MWGTISSKPTPHWKKIHKIRSENIVQGTTSQIWQSERNTSRERFSTAKTI